MNDLALAVEAALDEHRSASSAASTWHRGRSAASMFISARDSIWNVPIVSTRQIMSSVPAQSSGMVPRLI